MRSRLSNAAAVKRVLAAVIMLSSLVGLGIGLGVILDVHPAAATTNPILTAAQKEVGVHYCDGGGGINGPTHGVGTPQGGCSGTTVGFDCMSLAQYAVYQGTGGQAVIPDSGSPVVDGGQVISEADLEPGDAVFMGGSGPLADYAHSAIYAGNGMIWDDFTENDTVQLRTLASIQNPTGPYLFDGGVRYPTSGSPPPPTFRVTTTSLPAATIGVAYPVTQLSASGGVTPYRWKVRRLPKGLKGSSTKGSISGTVRDTKHPPSPGNYSVSVTVTDRSKPKQTATATLTLTLKSAN
jgi:hypothetical protein